MNNIESGTIKYLIILVITISLFGIILYPLFDLLLCKFITKSEFTYSVHSYIVQPILFGCIFGTVSWLVDKKRR